MGIDHFIGRTSPKLCVAAVSANRSKHRPRNSPAKNAMQIVATKLLTQQKRSCPYPPPLLGVGIDGIVGHVTELLVA